MAPPLTALVDSLPATVPFVGPEAQERARGRGFSVRLGANESVFGPSPHALRAMAEAAADAWQYGDPECHDLRTALADHLCVGPENVLVGEGIDGILGNLVRMLIAPGDRVVTSAGAYPTFNYHVVGFCGVLEMVPYRDDHEDPEALLTRAAETGARLIYLANPDNPMGTFHGPEVITDMLNRLPEGCLLALDEAYGEFAHRLPPLQADDPRVLRLRTFSKGYGLAGARVGYAIGAPELIDAFNRVRNHFGVGRISQAGALAALQDQRYIRAVVDEVTRGRERIVQIAADQGLTAVPSAANFVALDCGHDGGYARAVMQALRARDCFVRMPFVAPQDRCIRVTVGKPADLEFFGLQLPLALDAASEASG
ncbi:MAG: pyridoxal phosphate-dependent aminotransferase [Pseudomonadota bacterium]